MTTGKIVLTSVEAVHGLGLRERVAGPPAIPGFFQDVLAGVIGSGRRIVAAPIAVYHDPEVTPDSVDLEVVVPVAGPPGDPITTPAGRVLGEALVPGGEAAVLVHSGPYDTLHESYRALAGWVAEHGYRPAGPPQEIYLTGPDEPGPPVTELRMPVAPA
jgi:effector-binding domain-containing protein